MKSYFFVPASKLEKIDAISKSGVDEIIIDLEDAIRYQDRARYRDNLQNLSDQHRESLWIRVAVKAENQKDLDPAELTKLIQLGYRKFVIPKLSSAPEFMSLYESTLAQMECTLICLVENARFLLDLDLVLQQASAKISGLGIGSHDLMNDIQAEHQLENLEYPRSQILYLAKGYRKEAIDFADMEINDREAFRSAVRNGLQKGFDGKFLIHPRQISLFKEAIKPAEKEYLWAVSIMEHLEKQGLTDSNDQEPFILNGQVIEKPHILKAQRIINRYRNAK